MLQLILLSEHVSQGTDMHFPNENFALGLFFDHWLAFAFTEIMNDKIFHQMFNEASIDNFSLSIFE